VIVSARASVPILAAAAAFLAGAILRLATVSHRVDAVDLSWRAWSYHAATEGPARMYGPRGHTVSLEQIAVPVVYPPLARTSSPWSAVSTWRRAAARSRTMRG
jgi:hypothetical protein